MEPNYTWNYTDTEFAETNVLSRNGFAVGFTLKPKKFNPSGGPLAWKLFGLSKNGGAAFLNDGCVDKEEAEKLLIKLIEA